MLIPRIAVKIPETIEKVVISKNQFKGPFPPLRFVNIEEGNDGTGNNINVLYDGHT